MTRCPSCTCPCTGLRARSQRAALRAGGVALATRGTQAWDSQAVVRAVQAEVFPYERNWFREGDALRDSLARLDALWERLRQGAPAASAADAVRAREAAAMLATSRWMYRSALQRTETRGMHRRREHSAIDPSQRHRLLSGGLDEVWVQRHAVQRRAEEEVAA